MIFGGTAPAVELHPANVGRHRSGEAENAIRCMYLILKSLPLSGRLAAESDDLPRLNTATWSWIRPYSARHASMTVENGTPITTAISLQLLHSERSAVLGRA
jgi:hypothetical protein